MPIRPEDRHHYTRASGWHELRQRILERAKGCCERCGVRNHANGYRERDGRFVEHECSGDAEAMELHAEGRRLIRIVLTIAHLDHRPANRDPANLLAMCQKCHVTHDAQQHATNAARTRAKKRAIPGQETLFPEHP